MKRFNKVIAVLITVTMTFSMACVSGFATEADPYASLREGSGYVYIGDSYSRGHAATIGEDGKIVSVGGSDISPADDGSGYKYTVNTTGSYPYYVAQQIGIDCDKINEKKLDEVEGFSPLAFNALSTDEILALLGLDDSVFSNYNDDVYSERYSWLYECYGNESSYKAAKTKDPDKEIYKDINTMLKNAGLISIQLGNSDVTYKVKNEAKEDLANLSLTDTKSLIKEVSKLVGLSEKYYNSWTKSYRKLLDYVKKNNSSAKVVLIGALNPLEYVTFSDDVLLPIGSMFSVITERINGYIKKCAEEYGFIYVDISNVETPASTGTVSITTILEMMNDGTQQIASHPTKEGYEQIGRMIVAALDKELAKDAAKSEGRTVTPSTDVKIDIGNRYTQLNSVMLDGKKLSKKRYSFDEDKHVITVNCNNETAKTLNISIARFEKNTAETTKPELKITSMTYTLKWSDKSGYSARRVHVDNDVVGTAKTTVNTIKDTLKTLKGGLTAIKDKIGSIINNWQSLLKR